MALATQRIEPKDLTGTGCSSARSAAIMAHITRFQNRLAGVLEYGSFEYHRAEDMERDTSGQPQHHRCSYDLCIDEGVNLGEISVSRKTPFRESELQVLEACLSELCLQLRDINHLTD